MELENKTALILAFKCLSILEVAKKTRLPSHFNYIRYENHLNETKYKRAFFP